MEMLIAMCRNVSAEWTISKGRPTGYRGDELLVGTL